MNRLARAGVRLAALLALVLVAGPASGQTSTRLTIGGSLYSLRSSEASGTEYAPIVRLSGGLGFSFALRHGLFVRPELHYTIRGASLDAVLNGVDVDAVSEIAAIEVPVMVGLAIPVRGYVQPRIFAGPVVARVVDSSIRYRPASGGDWASESDSSIERTDIGIGAGAELAFPVGGQSLVAGVRGVVGLSNVVKPNPDRVDTPERRHVGLVFYAGILL